MDDALSFKTWLKELECPESYITDHVVQSLQKGVLGILWEDLPKIVRPYSEVIEARKNILLYKLENEPDDPLIKTVRDTSHLIDERKKLAEKIKVAEEKWKHQENICRQKAHALEKKKAERKKLVLKKNILKIKCDQLNMEIENCMKMKGVCQHLMPPTVEEIPQSVITNCLSLVSNYSGGPDKRKVWNKISEALDPIQIPVIFNALLTARSNYTDYLINLDIEENQQNVSDIKKKYIDHGIAKLCSEHFVNEAQIIIYQNKKKMNDKKTFSYVENIEQIIDELRPDLADWLPLTLEVKKLELWFKELQKEVSNFEQELPDQDDSVEDSLQQVIMEIKAADDKIADCVQKVKNHFGYLKSSRSLITKAKECLLLEQEKLKLLESKEENQWHSIDLSTELINFYNFDLDALRKIVIKGKTGAHKHLHTCYNQAPLIVNSYNRNDKISNFPMLRVPIYYLLDFYKSFLANVHLNKCINEETIGSLEDYTELSTSRAIVDFPYCGILELLRQVELVRNRTQQHSEDFERILKIWSDQTVREIVSRVFHDKTEYGLTLEEWQKRFSMIVYVLQKSNMSAIQI